MKQWLTSIMEGSGVVHGSPLFQYRVDADTLAHIRDALADELPRQPELDEQYSAGFVLFAAEWFRENYSGGPFNHSTILEEALGQPKFLLPASTLHSILRRGLQWWGLAVPQINGRSQYLSGTVCQGGMPEALLADEANAFRAYLREVLHEHEHHRHPTLEAAETEDHLLPQHLRNRAVHLWAAAMIEAVADLRERMNADGGSPENPLAFLDQQDAGWRHQIPQRLGSKVADELLRRLLRESRAPTAQAGLQAIETRLSNLAENSRIVRRLSLPATMTVEQMQRLFGLESKSWEASDDPVADLQHGPTELPHRFQIHLERNGITTPAAVASLTGGQNPRYRIWSSRGDVIDQSDSHLHVRLVMWVGSDLVKWCDAPGGDALSELVWSFEAEPPFRLIGTGPLQTSRDAIIIAARSCDKVRAVGNSETTLVGELPQCERSLFRVRGKAEIQDDEGVVRVSTSSPLAEESALAFQLAGESVRLGHNGTEVYRGTPRIEWWQNGSRCEDAQALQYRRPHEAWRTVDDQCVGDVQLRQLVDGQVAHRVGLTIVPSDFHFQTLPARSGYGVIRLEVHGNEHWRVEAADQQDANIQISRIEEQIDVTVTHEDTRPPFIELTLHLDHGAAARVRAGCPTAWSAVVDPMGNEIPRFSTVPLSDLRTFRLQAITLRHDPIYALSQGVSLNRYELQEHRQFEIPLAGLASRLEGMLTAGENDETVELEFSQLGLGPMLAKLSVSHHLGSVEVYRDGDGDGDGALGEESPLVTLAVSDELLDSLGRRAERLELEMCPLGYPEPVDVGDAVQIVPRDAVPRGEESEKDGSGQEQPGGGTAGGERPLANSANSASEPGQVTGAWRVDTSSLPRGPWLAVVWTDPTHCLRPVRVTAGDEADEPPEDIAEVDDDSIYDVIVAMRGRDNRRKAWDECVSRMTRSLEHPAWRPLHGLFKACRRFPVTTFQAVAAMSRHPTAMALVGLQHHDDDLWARIEQLPFLWGLIPIDSWTEAIELWRTHFEDSLSALPEESREATIQSAMRDFVGVATAACPALNCVVDCLTFLAPNVAPPDGAAAMRLMDGGQWKDRLHNQWQQLRRTRPGAQWPGGDLQLPDEIEALIEGLLIAEAKPAQRTVAKAPLAAAAYCVSPSLFPSTDQIQWFQTLRGFEPEWFDRAEEFALYWLARGYLEKTALGT